MSSERVVDLEAVLETMTLEEQVALMAGADSWTTVPIERLGIPSFRVTDGPNGARGAGSLVGGTRAACFPVGIALASTWNVELVERIGAALADEAHSKNARVLLAPTVNIHRSPLNGRNFECYSEDPFLAAQLACAYISGVQSRGVAATVKHYVGNESEYERLSMNSVIDERALREIYLPPFESAVRTAHVWAVMAAYNRVNGEYASQHPRLLAELLNNEWEYDGVVVSDWFATHSTAAAASAGLDLEMPGPTRYRGERLVHAVRAGEVRPEAIRERARRMLRLMLRVGAFTDALRTTEQAIDNPAHRALIRQAGAEGTVLLKNDGLLPLVASNLSSVCVVGPNAAVAQIMGGGSAQVNAHYRISPLQGISAMVDDRLEVRYAPGCTNGKLLPVFRGPLAIAYFDSPDLSGPATSQEEWLDGERMWPDHVAQGIDGVTFSARLSASYTPEESGEYQWSLVSAGLSRLYLDGQLVVDNWSAWQSGDTYFGAGSREVIASAGLEAGRVYSVNVEYAYPKAGQMGIRSVRIGVLLPLGDAAMQEAVQLAAASDVAIVCVGLNAEWDTEGHDRPHMKLVGRQDELVARVAAANPRTVVVLQSGGPLAMPWLEHVPVVLQAWYCGQECGNALADVLFGAAEPGGRLPQTFPVQLEDNPTFINYPGENGRVRYGEGLFVGYRYYDKKRIAPLFPFGHGLSYTTFTYTNLRLSANEIAPGGEVSVAVDVTNRGARAGQEVVQLYVRDPESHLARPERELKAFAKVSLMPGETRTVRLTLSMRSLAYFDDARWAWVADAGEFEVQLGSSSRDIRACSTLTLSGEWTEPVRSSPD